MIKPNPTFEVLRADEVAETMEGVPEDLYLFLWNEIVSQMKPIPNREDTGPHDHIGFECLANHWDKLTPEYQALLNQLAEEADKRWQAEAAKWRL